MATEIKDVGVWRQTKTLLYKNYLVKCRTKKNSVQEILYPIIWLLLLMVVSLINPSNHYAAMPNNFLGTLDEYTDSHLFIGYTPVTNATTQIMHVASSECFTTDVIIRPYADEEKLKDASASFQEQFAGVVFKDAMSYDLRFFPISVPISAFYIESRESCYSRDCEAATYFHSEFTTLQACIDSAIIKVKTNYSAWKELKVTQAVVMGEAAVVEIDTFPRAFMLIYLVMAFSSFGYSLAVHVVAEKQKKLKEFMKIMGLHDTAFWLPWVLLYSSFVLLMSLLMAVITTVFSPFTKSSCFLIFLLFSLYGISLVSTLLMHRA
ncbi:cholesterol transporter ABCA5-like [Ascaphus truei]|uniref:cholesterol transporter ABCA5-like n=1 Tax=Ascaphus truei TaxID=8439 RepID=UPI003F5A563E